MKTKTIELSRRRDFFSFFALLLLTFTVLPATAQMMYEPQNEEFDFSRYYYGNEDKSEGAKALSYLTNSIGTATAGDASDTERPFSIGSSSCNYHQIIYRKANFSSTSPCVISTIGYRVHTEATNASNKDNVDIYMGEVEDDYFVTNTRSFVPLSELTLVRSGAMVFSTTGWVDFELDTPFTYSGENNLVVAIYDHSKKYASGAKFYVYSGSTSTKAHIYVLGSGTNDLNLNNYGPTSSFSNSSYKFPQTRFGYEKLDAPNLSLPSGTYNEPMTCTITASSGATISYSTTSNSGPWTTAEIGQSVTLDINENVTVWAKASTSSAVSSTVSATYELSPLAPIITNAGIYGETINAIIEAGDADNTEHIYYTIDGTTPSSSNGYEYTVPFTVSSSVVVKAVAAHDGWTDSEVVSGEYRILDIDENMDPDDNPDGLVLNKTFIPAEPGNNNRGMLSLSSYVTGESVTTGEVVPPTDIVLLLDFSGSMTNNDIPHGNGTIHRYDALHDAVEAFLNSLSLPATQPTGSYAGAYYHRVAFVTYGDKGKLWYNQTTSPDHFDYANTTSVTGHASAFSSAFYTMDGSTTAFDAFHNFWITLKNGDGETELQYTMPLVEGIFENNPTAITNGNRARMVVVFTDGGIGAGHWGGSTDVYNLGYAEGKANYVLQKAKAMKDDGVTFFSVGIFPANPQGHSGGHSPYYSNNLAPYHEYTGTTFNEYSQEWADNVSRFMALRSSNYPNATSMTNTGSGSNSSGYFIIASNADQLTSAFTSISETVATPSLTLSSETVVQDVVSDAFIIPEGTDASDIKVYTAACTSVNPYTFADSVLWNGATVTLNGNSVCVSNFDFSENWCGQNTSTHEVHGTKLIINIPAIERNYGTTVAGGEVETNAAGSGVFNAANQQVGAFLSPLVYLSAPEGCFDFEDVTPTAWNVEGSLPSGWHGYITNGSGAGGVTLYPPHVVSGNSYDGDQSLLLASGYYTNGISYVTMPAMYFTYLFDKQISFYYKTPGTGNGECILEVGYVTSIPADNASDWASAFHSLQTLPASSESEAGSVFTVSLSGVPTYGDVYVTFKWCGNPSGPVLGADRYCYIDGVCVKDPVRLWTEAVTSINDVPSGGFVVDSETGDITINCEKGLAWLISYVNGFNGSDPHTLEGKTVTVTKPLIDMSEYIWVPIGYDTSHPFKGTFDACDNLISGVHVDGRQHEFIYVEDKYGPMMYAGMFGYTDGATVKNMSLLLSGDAAHHGKDHISSRCENGYLGALVGYGKDLNMELCYVFNGVVAYGNLESVGGLVGHAEGTGAIKACMSGAHLGAGLWNGSSNQIVIENLGGIVGSTGEGYAVKDGFSAFVDLQLKYYGSSLTAAGVENLGAVVGKGYATSNVYVHPLSLSLSTTVDGGTAPTNSYWYALEDENFDNVTRFTEAVPRTYDSYSVNNTINGRPLVDVLNDHVTPGFKWMTPPSPDVNLGYPVIVKEDDEAYAYFSLAVLDEHFLYLMRSDVNKIGTIATQLLSSKSSGEKADDESSMGIYMYSNGNISLGIPALINMHIDENVAVTQSTAEDVNTSVGITIKNPNGSGAEHRDWHTFATPLKQVPLGIKYCEADQSHTGYAPGADNFLVFGPEGVTSYDYAIDENGYFPAGIANRTQFDLYSYYEPEYHWINLKRKPNNHWHEDEVEGSHPQINYDGETGQTVLEQGKGYLVGLGTTTENNNYMQARGALTNGVVKHAVTAAGGNLKGYNLLGNPYQSYLDFHEFASVNEDVLWGEGNTTDTGYMAYLIFDAERNRFEQYLVDDDYIGFSDGAATTTSRYLNMHQGFFVVKRTEDPSASNVSDSVVFNNDMRVITPNAATYRSDVHPAYPLVNLFCTDADGNQEIVIMELERPLKAGSTKMKGMLNGKCNMYAHWGNDDLGAVFIDYMPDYVPVWFEAAEDGVFTITWSTANENFGYMHLIDNIAGVDYDCLAPGNDSYTFHATTTDMIARFRVVFKPMGIEEEIEISEHGENFAFFNGNELIVNGEGDMRLTDLNGRCVYTQHLAGQQNSVSLPVVADGMYLLQLNGAEGVKVQKIVIRK